MLDLLLGAVIILAVVTAIVSLYTIRETRRRFYDEYLKRKGRG